MTKLEAIEAIVKSAFSLRINISDSRAWGVSDSCELDGDDVETIAELYTQYGFETLMAYGAVQDDCDGDPDHIKKYFNFDNYTAAKDKIRNLADSGEIMYDRYRRIKQEKKDVLDFGCVVKWGSVPTRRTSKFIKTDKYTYHYNFAKIPGLVAIGASYFDTRTRLLAKASKRKTNIK